MNELSNSATAATPQPRPPMAKKWLIAILVTTFAFILMPFLLWYMTTFSRPLNDAELANYFSDSLHPRHAQHALSQIADRMMSASPAIRNSAKPWYPQVMQFAEQGSDELRVTSAWVMGQDAQSPEFHAALLKQLNDGNPMVVRNAALSLVRFQDESGHDIIAGMLSPYAMPAPRAGILTIRLKPGDFINPGTLVGHVAASGSSAEVRSLVPGTLLAWLVADGATLQAGQPMLQVDPSPEMAWESLRALFLIGKKQDLTAVNRYVRGVDGMPTQVQQQAALTAKAISARTTP